MTKILLNPIRHILGKVTELTGYQYDMAEWTKGQQQKAEST